MEDDSSVPGIEYVATYQCESNDEESTQEETTPQQQSTDGPVTADDRDVSPKIGGEFMTETSNNTHESQGGESHVMTGEMSEESIERVATYQCTSADEAEQGEASVEDQGGAAVEEHETEEEVSAEVVTSEEPTAEEVVVTPEEPTVEEPAVQETAEETVEETAVAAVEETAEAAAQELAVAAVEETVVAAVEETVEAAMEETVEAAVEETAEAAVEETAAPESTVAAVEETTDFAAEVTTDEAVEVTTNVAMEESAEAEETEQTDGNEQSQDVADAVENVEPTTNETEQEESNETDASVPPVPETPENDVSPENEESQMEEANLEDETDASSSADPESAEESNLSIDFDEMLTEDSSNTHSDLLKGGVVKKPSLMDESKLHGGFSGRWTNLVRMLHEPIHKFLHAITKVSARNPRTTVVTMTIISLTLVVTGLLTNFYIDVDEDTLWTPRNSPSTSNMKWIKDESGFEPEPRWLVLLFHNDGGNVLSQHQVQLMFDVVDAIREVDGYDEMCKDVDYRNNNGVQTCQISGPPQLWNTSSAIFQKQVHSDAEAIEQLSAKLMPDYFPVIEEVFYGFPERDENELLTSAVSYSVFFHLPHVDIVEDVEERALDVILKFRDEWREDPNSDLFVEVAAERSFPDEFTRAIITDIPLVPIVFFMMSSFTCAVFFKKHKIYSRSLLGVSAVVAVLLSIGAAYGLLFIIGIPFTSITQMLPFIIFGIGLDDSFIVMGAYARTDPRKSAIERMEETVDSIGISITLTTVTSGLAFSLGCSSQVPAVYWVCLYAFPSVFMVYIYQLTFFVGCIILDQKRIDERRRDCCTYITVDDMPEPKNDDQASDDVTHNSSEVSTTEEFFVDRWMVAYADFLLQPVVKCVVVTAFAALAGLCIWSATHLRQEFKFKDVLPSDSYITPFIEGREDYSSRSHLLTYIYFRDLDQSKAENQRQMFDYIENLTTIEAVTGRPDLIWMEALDLYVENVTTLKYLTFTQQLDVFLNIDIADEVFGADIVRDEEGKVIASRVLIDMGNLDADDIQGQIAALEGQKTITDEQPINQGKDRDAFFTYSRAYNIWEFYAAAVDELMFAAVTGVVSVTIISVFMVPHWSAAVIVFPMMLVLYIDLLGVMQWGGVTINPVSYVALAMSVGLLVDFIMHVLLRYYEVPGNRREKTVAMLQTMGSSIFLGGITTFLGTVPLVFSTSEIFYIVFMTFMGLVTLGVGHGLILLPVILSVVGTEEQVTAQARRLDEIPHCETSEDDEENPAVEIDFQR